MNWRGRPLTSHEVIVQTIAATTTRTGLRVRAELDTSAYDTGIKVSDRQMDALPLTRHDWHGDWNYTLRPEDYDQAAGAPDPSGQPSPDLAWLCHPALTGLSAQEWDALITTLMTLHDQRREADLDKRRGHRPRLAAPGTGRRPVLTLADRLLATTLHQRLALPQVVIAALFTVRPETINRRIRDIRQLLDQAGHAIQPGPYRLASLDDLYSLAAAEHHHSTRDQDSVLIICNPLVVAPTGTSSARSVLGRHGEADGVMLGAVASADATAPVAEEPTPWTGNARPRRRPSPAPARPGMCPVTKARSCR